MRRNRFLPGASWFQSMAAAGAVFDTTVETSVPEPTANEIALQNKQIQLAEFQLQELQRQSDFQQEFAAGVAPLLEAQTADAEAALAERERLGPIQEELLTLALEDLRRGGKATPEQIELIQQAGDAALERGGVDIERFRTDSLEALREELAPALGLRGSDTPILDRGGRVAAEATRQGGQLASSVRGAEATARLNFPLAQSQLTQQSSLGLSQLTAATSQFQDQLRQQAFANRLNLQSSVGGLGLSLSTGVPFNVNQGVSVLQQSRFANSTQTTGGLGTVLGPLIEGSGRVGAAFATSSSRKFKEDIETIPEGHALDAVEKLDLATWRYKPEMGLGRGRHAGPMAEDMRSLGLSDGETVQPMDSAGLSLAAVKDLARKVAKIERGLGLAKAA